MIGTIRKHQTWLWAVIITATIISFVWYFGPQSKVNAGRGGGDNLGSINGERLTREEYGEAEREVYLRHFFTTGNFPNEDSRKSGFDPLRDTYYRLLLLHKQKDLGIHISSDQVAQTARNMLRPLQKANINTPAMFVKQILEPRGFQVDDFERFVRHELGIQELISTVGLSGKLVTQQEVKGLYEREHEELAAEVVFFSATNFLASVTVTPGAVSMFYSNHIANYRIPERIQVNYVEFVLTNFQADAIAELGKMTNINDRIDAVYQQRGTNYYKDVKSPEEAKEKIREEMRHEMMTILAGRKANAFATQLYDKEPMRAENLLSFAKEKELTVKVTAPFDRDDGPRDIHVNAEFAKKAFSLTPTNEPFAGPLVGEDAVYVIALDKRVPSEIPPLDQIRDRVTADYKFDQAKSLARQAGEAFYVTATNGLSQGKGFSNICAEAKVQALVLAPFSLSTRAVPELEGRLSPDQIKQLAFSTSPGKLSNFQPTIEGGVIVMVKSKLPIDQAKMSTELPAFVDYVRQTRQSEAFNEWFRRQAERGLRDTPLMWQKPATPALGARSTAAKS